MFHTDKAIQSRNEDKLGRKSFAENLGQAILSHEDSDSIVLGFYGEWGSGKTSTINMALDYIEKSSTVEENKPIIIKFNPWLFSDQKQLINEFFRQLSVVLRRGDYGADAKSAGEMLETYSKFFIPLTFIEPVTATIASQVFEKVGLAAKSWGDLKKNDLNAVKDELNKLLEKQTRKILVLIDDIDRLSNDEIKQIFQLVKSVADFPNTMYLLAFDRDVIINALKEVQKGSGEAYLEKIIQIPIVIPDISHSEIEKLLFDGLNEVLGDIPDDKFDKNYWADIYQEGIRHYFHNIRDVNRYLNSFGFAYSAIKEEVNPIDFIAITAIKVFMPEIYNEIKNNKDIFVGTSSSSGRELKDKIKSICDDIIGKIDDKKSREFLEHLLVKLFPKLINIYGGISSNGDSSDIWGKNKRICKPEYFEIYFKLSLPPGRFTQQEMQSILSKGDDLDTFKEALLSLNANNRMLQFLDQIDDYTDAISDKNIENVITAFMDIGDLLPDKDTGFLSIGSHVLIVGLSHKLSKKWGNQEKRFELFSRVINKVTNSLYSVVYEVKWQENEHKQEVTDQQIVNDAQLETLKGLACQKIKLWADDNKLPQNKKLSDILLAWKRWGGAQDVGNFIENLIATNEGIMQLVRGFSEKAVKTKWSQVNSTYEETIQWLIGIEDLKEFVDIENFYSKLNNIHSSEKFEQLEEEQQILVQDFLKAYNGQQNPNRTAK